MRKKLFILAGIGFLAGMIIGNLIAWFAGGSPVNHQLAEWLGSNAAAVIVQTLLSGILGAIAFGGMLVHEIERWPIALSCVVHYLLIEVTYVPTALLLKWIEGPTELLITVGIQTVVYFIIWVIMYLRYKAEVRKLNELLKKGKDGKKESNNDKRNDRTAV